MRKQLFSFSETVHVDSNPRLTYLKIFHDTAAHKLVVMTYDDNGRTTEIKIPESQRDEIVKSL